MRTQISDALQALADYDELELNMPFYHRLLEEDLSDCIAELSFIECCGELSLFYDNNNHSPSIMNDNLFSYLNDYDDYHIPLGLLTCERNPYAFFFLVSS